MTVAAPERHAATQNACRLCAPLGASIAFKGLERTVPLLHGSQGCATYIRRYMISHFREPVDIASSAFSETTAVFGGERNLHQAITNVCKQYRPSVVGIATTCLSETIGDNVPMYLADYRRNHENETLPPLVHVSTPSYNGSHVEGYRDTITAMLQSLVRDPAASNGRLTILPSLVSPADLRFLRSITSMFAPAPIIFPDYSDTLDGPFWPEYQVLPEGGTPLDDVRAVSGSCVALELGYSLARVRSPGSYLKTEFGVPHVSLDLPVGVVATDRFLHTLREFTNTPIPEDLRKERGRVLDAYADAHKYLFGRRVGIYGEPDLVVALTAFACEVGLTPVFCATGCASMDMEAHLRQLAPALPPECLILEDADFADVDRAAHTATPEMLLGSSKGFKTARKLDIPVVRVGFPIHDRFGAQRVRLLGYDGALSLLDRIVNTILEIRQMSNSIGYTYL